MKRLSLQEFILGFFSTALLVPKLGLLVLLSTLLWPLGGTSYKGIRRYGVPVLVSCVACWKLDATLPFLCIPFGVLVLSIGDGCPDPFSGDKGSWLGQQVVKVVSDLKTAGLVTKIIPVLLLQGVWLCLMR